MGGDTLRVSYSVGLLENRLVKAFLLLVLLPSLGNGRRWQRQREAMRLCKGGTSPGVTVVPSGGGLWWLGGVLGAVEGKERGGCTRMRKEEIAGCAAIVGKEESERRIGRASVVFERRGRAEKESGEGGEGWRKLCDRGEDEG
ncbi:hypothetical protein HAX54_003735 [Datura stramonium]|uniref:Uncharacterized protein n=1 Tax=Datura stramonium TaxID=4076 RepID=A0ABS8WXB7_DATST|nr:hypothetical protein [Datura stramonium]